MIGPIVSALAFGQIRQSLRRAQRNAVLSLAAAGLLLAGGVFLVAAIFFGLVEVMHPGWAALLIAVAFLLAGGAMLLVKRTNRPAARSGNAALIGALSGAGAAAAIDDDDDPPPPRRPRPRKSGAMTGKAVLALPVLAFVAALVAGRKAR